MLTNDCRLDVDLLIKAVNFGPAAVCNISLLDMTTFQFVLNDRPLALSASSDIQVRIILGLRNMLIISLMVLYMLCSLCEPL